MNVDPREIGDDDGLDLFGKLSDDEKAQSDVEAPIEELNEIEREMQKMQKKMEALKEKQAELQEKAKSRGRPKVERQVSRTPSPKKPKVEVKYEGIKPRNLNSRLFGMKTEDTLVNNPSRSVSEAPSESSVVGLASHITSTPSYFLQNLEETKKKQEEQHAIARKLIQSRVYTFDSTLEVEPQAVNEREYYSGLQLSRRYVDGQKLKEFFEDKKVMRLPKLMGEVCPPDFEEPKYPNWVVVAILSKKSQPKVTGDGRSKYISLTLSDFKFSLQVTMFGKAVEKYNKLRAGDVIAILNPDIYIKYEAGAGFGAIAGGVKTFSLTIKHAGDSILEIGRSKDFGNCPSLRKDGTICSEPINRAVEQCCSYHQELRMRKTAGKRMEFQTSVRQVSPTRNGIKQDFLLGKPDNRGNWTSSSIVPNMVAPANDRISKAMKHFSSTNKHHAFFNSEVTDLSDIKKKQLKQDDYKKRVNDIKLQKQLHESLQGAKNLKKFSKVKLDEDDKNKIMTIEQKRALLRFAYGPKGLSNLGFDPSSHGASKGILSFKDEDQKAKASATAAELSDLAKKRKVDLGTADEVLKLRREQWKKTTEYLKKIKKEPINETVVKKKEKEKKAEPIDVPVPSSFMDDGEGADQASGYGAKESVASVFELSDSDSEGGLEELDMGGVDPSAFKKFKEQLQVKLEKGV